MSYKLMILAAALAVATGATESKARTIPVCSVSSAGPHFIGKRVTLDGYIVDLGSHGFVLTAKRGCKGRSLVPLWVNRVLDTAVWRRAFAGSLGPKHAILTGIIYWERNRSGSLVAAMRIERVESISAHEASFRDL